MSTGKATVQKNAKASGGKPTVQKYHKVVAENDSLKQRYSKLNKEHTGLRQRYSKLEAEKNALDEEVVELRSKERYAKRESAIMELESQGYAIDREEELRITEDFTDEQFERHVTEVVPTRYSKVSGDFTVPVDAIARDKRKPTEDENQRRVAEEKHASEASNVTLRYRRSGRPIAYKKVLDHLIENDGQVKETELFSVNGNGAA